MNPGGKNGLRPGGSRIPELVAPAPLTLTPGMDMLIPAADENIGWRKLKGDPPGKLAANPGNIDAAAAAAAEFASDTDGPVLDGNIDELPEPVDDGLGDSEGFARRALEEDTLVEDADTANELLPMLGDGDTLWPDLDPGEDGR